MRRKSSPTETRSERLVRDIRRATSKQYSAEEKIRIVLDGLRGEVSIAGSQNDLPTAYELPYATLRLAQMLATSCRVLT